MTGDEKEQNEVEIGKRQKQYLATIGDGPVEDGGRLLLAQWRAGDYVEAYGVGTGVTIAQEHLLDLKLYHK